MSSDQICEKAIELGFSKDDLEISKEVGNGWVIIPLNDKNVEELREYINKK